MQIILKQDIKGLGKRGEIKDVKPGYARNYLIPKKFAVVFTKENLKVFENEQKHRTQKENRLLLKAQKLQEKLKDVSCVVKVKVGEEDRIFGTITNREISENLKSMGFDIKKQDIIVPEPIKKLGVYTVEVKIYKDVSVKLKLVVVKEE